ncbi:minor capsid protein 2 [Micromonospora sp. Llam0]|uniref:phage minor capsid protein n=1 Tax=Micromonospora sp. Llam0 TaxID=2485143 RepID=UPI000F9C88CD|nr:phage minor capsid protein [Micromonospora sp. Llam0]ROO51067.1 minor capsid protein 2 [Micromonospora sp. Llam0]
MALDADQLDAVSRASADLYREAESAIVREVTRRLAAGAGDAPDWAVERLGAVAQLRRAVERILELTSTAAGWSIRDAIASAYRSGTALATTQLPSWLVPGDPDLGGARSAVATVPRVAAMESLAAATVADVGAKSGNVLRNVLDVYRSVIQQATAVSIAGGMTRLQASQHAYAKFVDQGVVSFRDVSGRRWRLSSYVEMATRTVTQRAAVQGQTDRLTSRGVDLVIISNSPRECPLCRPHENRIYSISGSTPRGRQELPSMVGPGTVTVDVAGTLTEARAAGLFHPNCTHSARSFLPGATRIPAGDTSNPQGYEAKDRQRAIERNIRRWKEREQAALTPEAKTAARAKVRQWQGAMRQHLDANPELKRLRYRESIGAGNMPRRPRPDGPITAEDLGLPDPQQPAAPAPPAPTSPPAPPPAAPQPAAAPTPQPVSRRQPANTTDPWDIAAQLTTDAEQVELRQLSGNSTPVDLHLRRVGQMQGFDGLPQVGTRAELDVAVASGWTEVWRGVVASRTGKTAAQINADLRAGPYEPGRGMYGNGYYTSTRWQTAETYRGRDPRTDQPARPDALDFEPSDYEGDVEPDSLLRIAIDPNARIVDLADIQRQIRASGVDATDPAVAAVLTNPGRYAAGAGYDILRITGEGDGALYPGWETSEDDVSAPQAPQYVILNRTVMLIQRAEDVP